MLPLWLCGKGGGKDGRMAGDARSGFPSPWSMQTKLDFRVKTSASGTAKQRNTLVVLPHILAFTGWRRVTHWKSPEEGLECLLEVSSIITTTSPVTGW